MAQTQPLNSGGGLEYGPRHLKLMSEGTTVTVETIRGFAAGGKSYRPGDIAELSRSDALIVIGSGKAKPSEGKPKAKAKAKPEVSEPTRSVTTRKKKKALE